MCRDAGDGLGKNALTAAQKKALTAAQKKRKKSLQPDHHVSTGKGEKIILLLSRMDRPVLFVPFSERRVFLHDAQAHDPAVHIPGRIDGMLQQRRADSLMPVLRQHGKIAQFAFAVLFKKQRNCSVVCEGERTYGSRGEVSEGSPSDYHPLQRHVR